MSVACLHSDDDEMSNADAEREHIKGAQDGFCVGQFVFSHSRCGTKGTQGYAATYEVGRIKAFVKHQNGMMQARLRLTLTLTLTHPEWTHIPDVYVYVGAPRMVGGSHR